MFPIVDAIKLAAYNAQDLNIGVYTIYDFFFAELLECEEARKSCAVFDVTRGETTVRIRLVTVRRVVLLFPPPDYSFSLGLSL